MKRWMIAIGCMIIALAAGIGFAVAGRGKTAGIEEAGTEQEQTPVVEVQETAGAEESGAGRNQTQDVGSAGRSGENPESDKPETVRVENPSWDYYMEVPEEAETEPLELAVLEETKNEITDEEKWFAENGLELPDLNDEGYSCQVHESRTAVDIIRNGETEVTLDFSDYQYADDFLPEEREFIDQEIHSAAVREGILYLSTFHYTYAESSPHTAYITAVSLEDYRVLWKTEPLTCNSLNFEMAGDVILCGYGFTAEDDYLYQVDRKTGKRIGQTPLASMADYIIYKDGKLFVRTYHTDYIFQVTQRHVG